MTYAHALCISCDMTWRTIYKYKIIILVTKVEMAVHKSKLTRVAKITAYKETSQLHLLSISQ